MKPLYPAITALAVAFGLAGCSDPSDNVPKSAGSAPETSPEGNVAGAKEYVIQTNSTIGFIGSKVTGSHHGGFHQFEGNLSVADGRVVTPSVIKISMDSIWADNDRLTGHLKSPDFFDVQNHPTSTFTMIAVEPEADGFQVTGNLDLHGVIKSISFPANIQVSDDAVKVKAEFAINRKDFDITYPGKPDDLIRDNVVIQLDITGRSGG